MAQPSEHSRLPAPADDALPEGRTALFRQEAISSSSTRYGSPVRPIGVAAWALTTFMLVTLIGATVFLASNRYARKETVVGVIQPTAGAARVTPMVGGVVTQVFVTEGQSVAAGDPILTLSTDRSVANEGDNPVSLSAAVASSSGRESRAMAEQAEARAEADRRSLEDLVVRRRGLEMDQTHLRTSAAMQEERIRLAAETLQAGQALHERELFSTLQLRQREEALLGARQSLGEITREIRRNEMSLSQLSAEEGRLRASAAQARAEADVVRAQFEQRQVERQAEGASLLVAAVSGKVVALQARPGTPALPGRTLGVVLPSDADLQAELWLPSRSVGFLEVGAPVRLMFDAFPYSKFGVGRGRVRSIAGAPTEPADLPLALETNEALYRVLVTIDQDAVDGYGRQWKLVPGMRLTADVVLDSRSFLEWLFDPIFAARQRNRSS